MSEAKNESSDEKASIERLVMCGTTNEEKPFEPGDIIDFCGDRYEVRSNYGSSGKVSYAGDRDEFSFYWVFEGEPCRRVATT